MGNSQPTKLNLEDLPIDIFEVADIGLSSRSLTAGHGMTEVGASCQDAKSCSCPIAVCSFCAKKRVTEEESTIH
jgi:hypothetical protein